jgi:hypothetical protein
MKNISNLSKDIDLFEKALRRAANETAKTGTVQTIAMLASVTPVDTSEALSNWRASVGFPTSKSIEPYFKGDMGSTQGASLAATIAAAKLAVQNKKPGQNCFIVNSADHMPWLAGGGSGQQPNPGWIEAVGNISEKNWLFKYPTRIG